MLLYDDILNSAAKSSPVISLFLLIRGFIFIVMFIFKIVLLNLILIRKKDFDEWENRFLVIIGLLLFSIFMEIIYLMIVFFYFPGKKKSVALINLYSFFDILSSIFIIFKIIYNKDRKFINIMAYIYLSINVIPSTIILIISFVLNNKNRYQNYRQPENPTIKKIMETVNLF